MGSVIIRGRQKGKTLSVQIGTRGNVSDGFLMKCVERQPENSELLGSGTLDGMQDARGIIWRFWADFKLR